MRPPRHPEPDLVDNGFKFACAGYFPVIYRVTGSLYSGNLKLFLPTWRLQPYALAGIGLTSWRLDIAPGIPLPGASDTGFAFRGGAGVDIYLTESIVLNTEGTAVLNTAQFVLPGTGAATIQSNLYYFSLSAGLTYRF